MQRTALLLSGAGSTAVGQRSGPRAPSPALAPGGARALHDVSRSAIWVALGDAGSGICVCRIGGGGGCDGQKQQQELQHRGPETEGQKARGGARTVTCGMRAKRLAPRAESRQWRRARKRLAYNFTHKTRTLFMFHEGQTSIGQLHG